MGSVSPCRTLRYGFEGDLWLREHVEEQPERSRQAVAAVNVYDLDAEVHRGVPVVPSTGALDDLRAALCA
jgi:hypothetical protein